MSETSSSHPMPKPIRLPRLKCPYCEKGWQPRKTPVNRCPRCKHPLKSKEIKLPTRTCLKCNKTWNPRTMTTEKCPACYSEAWMVADKLATPAHSGAGKTAPIILLALLVLSALFVAPTQASSPTVTAYSCPVGATYGCDNLNITANWTDDSYISMNGTHPFIYLDNGTNWNATTAWNYTGWASQPTGTGVAARFVGFNFVNLSAPPTGQAIFNNTENASSLGDPGLNVESQNLSMYLPQFGQTIQGSLANIDTPIVYNGYTNANGYPNIGTDTWGKLHYNTTYNVWTGIANYLGHNSTRWNMAFANWSATSLQIQFRYAPQVAVTGNVTPYNNTPTTFYSNPTLGAKPYHFHWFVNGTEIANTTQNATITFSSVGPKFVRAELYDSGKGWANSTMEVNVTPALAYPPNVLVGTSQAFLDVGQSVNLSMSASGGVPPYTYQWKLNGTTTSEPQAFAFVPKGAAIYYFNATATGKNGLTGWQALNESVSPTLQTTVTASGQNVLVGTPVTFTATLHGGLAPYTYAWFLNGTAQTGITSGNVTYTPKGGGTYNFTVEVMDANGERATSTYLLQVQAKYAPPSVSVTISRSYMDLGQPVYLNSTVTGGAYPLTYQWSATNGSLSSTSQPDVVFNASTWGPATVTLTVTDQRGNISTKQETIQVFSDPVLTSTVLPFKAIVGTPINGTMSVSGGRTPISVEWLLNGTTSLATSSNFTYLPMTPGSYAFQARATDANAVLVVGKTFSVTVYPMGTYLPPVVSANASAQSFDQGQSVILAASVLYGSAPFVFAWHTGVLTNNGSTGTTLSLSGNSILQQGRYAWSVMVTDAQGNTSWAFGNITGYPQTHAQVGTSISTNGTTATLSISASGGKGPYWFNLTVLNSSGVLQGNPKAVSPYTYWINNTKGGTYRYSLLVKDANGQLSWANGTVKVPGLAQTTPPQGSPIGIFSGWGLTILIGGGGGVALFLLLAILTLRKRNKATSSNPAKTEETKTEGDSSFVPLAPIPPAVSEWDERTEDSDVMVINPTGVELVRPQKVVTPAQPPEGSKAVTGITMRCPNCGGVNILTEVTATTICPDCYVYYKRPKNASWRAIPKKGQPKVSTELSEPTGQPTPQLPAPETPPVAPDTAPTATPTVPPPNPEDTQHLKQGIEKLLGTLSAEPALPVTPVIVVEDLHTIGEKRSEESPFTDLKPEDVNPNAQHIDPALLQPMEMRVTQDRGEDTRSPSNVQTVTDAQRKSQLLMERARRERLERLSRKAKARAGVLQEEKPVEGQ